MQYFEARIVALLPGCFGFMGPALAGGSYSQSEAEKYIKESSSQWAESVATNDASVVKRILADDFLWMTPHGKLRTKAQMVEDAASGPGEFISNHLDNVQVRFFGDTAVAQGSETWERKVGNACKSRYVWPRKGRFVWTDTWVRRNGQWQIVAAQDTIVPIDPPEPSPQDCSK